MVLGIWYKARMETKHLSHVLKHEFTPYNVHCLKDASGQWPTEKCARNISMRIMYLGDEDPEKNTKITNLFHEVVVQFVPYFERKYKAVTFDGFQRREETRYDGMTSDELWPSDICDEQEYFLPYGDPDDSDFESLEQHLDLFLKTIADLQPPADWPKDHVLRKWININIFAPLMKDGLYIPDEDQVTLGAYSISGGYPLPDSLTAETIEASKIKVFETLAPYYEEAALRVAYNPEEKVKGGWWQKLGQLLPKIG